MKWLASDLASKRTDRREAAWRAIKEYGDDRLLPLLESFVGKTQVMQALKWGPLRTYRSKP